MRNNRIAELIIKRSWKHPRFGYAIALYAGCKHRVNLGVCLFPKQFPERNWVRVETVKVFNPIEYAVAERLTCLQCEPDEFWLEHADLRSALDEEMRTVDFDL